MTAMRPRVLECPRCGAPLPRRAALVKTTCEYCRSDVVFERFSVRAADYRSTLQSYLAGEHTDVQVAGFPLRLLGRLAIGHSSDVFLATRSTRLGERLVLKVLRSRDDEALAQNEQSVLARLEGSAAPGSAYFTTLVPQRAFSGVLAGAGFPSTFAAAFRRPSGLTHTLEQVARAFPAGIDPRHSIWLWRRALELLSWLHQSGVVHGQILPAHVLVDAREHAVGLVGFSCAGRIGAVSTRVDPRAADLYPSTGQVEPSPATDLIMLARCLHRAVGGPALRLPDLPAHVPAPLARLLAEQATGVGSTDAAGLSRQVLDVARACFGPPRFIQLELP
jgi:hypothetical protein